MRSIVLILTCIAMSGCSGLGPDHLERSRGAYIEALAQTDREELLANIIRLRYREAPVFMQISSITAAPSLEVGVDSDLAIGPGEAQTGIVKPNLTYKQSPTIVYQPLLGKDFARELLVPLGLPSVLLMIENGWPIPTVLKTTVSAVNGIEASGESAALFAEVLELFAVLSQRRQLALGTSVSGAKAPGDPLRLRLTPDGRASTEGQRLIAALRLDPQLESYSFQLGLDGDGETIALRTRPLLAVMEFLSRGVELPPKDQDFAWTGSATALPDLRIRASRAQPPLSFISLQRRGHWFWIEDNDIASRETFALLRLLFNLQAQKDGSGGGVQLTLPVR